jgi:DNA-binding LytR/AlgR family response regulator
VKPLDVMIVEDEPIAQRRMQLLLSDMPGVSVSKVAAGRLEALKVLKRHSPDVILLDIRLRDGTGFDLLDGLSPEETPAIVFVTAFDSHAVAAFDTLAIDYLLKPVERSRLERALDRARGHILSRDAEERAAEMRDVLSALREGQTGRHEFETELWVRRNASGLVRIAVDQIDYATAEDDYVRLHLPSHSYLTSERMSGLERRLDPRSFIRIHRSSIVRIAAVKEIRRTPTGALEAIMNSGARLRVGRLYTKPLRDMLRAC